MEEEYEEEGELYEINVTDMVSSVVGSGLWIPPESRRSEVAPSAFHEARSKPSSTLKPKETSISRHNVEPASVKSTSRSITPSALAPKVASSNVKPPSVYSSSPSSTASSSSDLKNRTLTPEEKQQKRKEKDEEIQRIMRIIRAAEIVDLCFLLDCTGSMQPHIDAVKNNIIKLQEHLVKELPNLQLHLGFVRYTDFDVPSTDRYSVFDFSSDVTAFKNFVSNIKAVGGGDAAEDVFGGLALATTRLKWKSPTRVLIHIADAPCHGTRFHGGRSINDYHPGGDPNHNEENMMYAVNHLNIQYWFGYIDAETTNPMINVFNDKLSVVSKAQSQIKQFDAKKEIDLLSGIYDSVTASVAKTVFTTTNTGASERPYTIDRAIPSWDSIKETQVFQYSFKINKLTIEGVCSDDFTQFPGRINLLMKIAPNPFAHGAQRLAYYGWNVTHEKQVVLKQYKTLGRKQNCMKRYLEEMETSGVAAFFALRFNKARNCKGGDAIPIAFNVTKVVHLANVPVPYYMELEGLIEGEYKKFNSNNGFTNKKEDSNLIDVLSAFSHWTWIESKKYLLVVDLQGVKNEKGLLLTDPAIHCKNNIRYGNTNLSMEGVERFFSTHVCGHTCISLDLPVGI